jgi:hypothetical protein
LGRLGFTGGVLENTSLNNGRTVLLFLLLLAGIFIKRKWLF